MVIYTQQYDYTLYLLWLLDLDVYIILQPCIIYYIYEHSLLATVYQSTFQGAQIDHPTRRPTQRGESNGLLPKARGAWGGRPELW